MYEHCCDYLWLSWHVWFVLSSWPSLTSSSLPLLSHSRRPSLRSLRKQKIHFHSRWILSSFSLSLTLSIPLYRSSFVEHTRSSSSLAFFPTTPFGSIVCSGRPQPLDCSSENPIVDFIRIGDSRLRACPLASNGRLCRGKYLRVGTRKRESRENWLLMLPDINPLLITFGRSL